MIRKSLAPVIRAASTNSFSRSDSTTRANDARRVEPAEDTEDQREREHPGNQEPPNVIALSVSPAVHASAMMKRRAGKTMTISVRRETIVSTQPRK